MNGQLRVLAVSSTAEPWGAELAMATYLDARPPGVEPRVLCLADGALVDRLRDRSVPTAVDRLEGRPSLARATRFARNLYRDLLRDRPNVILATGNKAAVLTAPAARAARVPWVWHRVDFAMSGISLQALAAASSGVIGVSRPVLAEVPPTRRLATVPPPVRFAEAFRVSNSRPPAAVGSIGQLHPIKGHHDIISACALLKDEFPELSVVIAGGAHPAFRRYPDELARLAQIVGIEERVQFTGHADPIEDVLSQLTVVASGTFRDRGLGPEGFGAALAEASWAGLPVVATNGGGVREAVVDGVTGRLVPERDPERMADGIAAYLSDPELSRAAGEAGARFTRGTLRPAHLAERLFSVLTNVAGLA